MSGVDVRVVHAEAAPDVLAVIREAFGARPELDPPADALSETVESVAAELAAYGGLLATLDGRPVGSLLFDDSGPGIMLRRFGVVPSAQGSRRRRPRWSRPPRSTPRRAAPRACGSRRGSSCRSRSSSGSTTGTSRPAGSA